MVMTLLSHPITFFLLSLHNEAVTSAKLIFMALLRYFHSPHLILRVIPHAWRAELDRNTKLDHLIRGAH